MRPRGRGETEARDEHRAPRTRQLSHPGGIILHMDIGKFLRLQGAIGAAIDSGAEGRDLGASDLAGTYRRLRAEVRGAVEAQHWPEFDRLFPESLGGFPQSQRGDAEKLNAARRRLAMMAGWLEGFVKEARMDMEAQAYAAARVREERGIGFKGSESS